MRILRWAARFWTGVLVVSVALAGLLLGLRQLLPLVSTPPVLRAAVPPDNAAGVPVRAPLVLAFDRAMNPRSVEAALQISPTLQWRPSWDAARTTLTISPTTALLPAADYELVLGTGALSQRFRALPQPIALRFRTAQAPAVIGALPPDNAAEVPLDSPISITFSRTIVPAADVQRPRALPELRFDPPIAGQATWLDQSTVLFRPSAPLQPATRYRATLDAALADVSGGQLGSAYSWSFSTPAPRLLELAPADGARLVPPRATLVLTFSQPLALEAVRATLAFSPTIPGVLDATTLIDGRQRITLMPDAALRPGTTYTATLQAGIAPVAGNLPLLQPVRWSFSTAPRPSLTARFPGEGQTLPGDQEIRLVFNTPMDGDAVRAALRIEPDAPNVRVSASASEVRIRADLRAATVYTLTLPPDLPDLNGTPLGQGYRMRFLTAPAGPALELPELDGHVAQLPPGAPAELLLRRTNLSALAADLYRLDEATLVRVLNFRAEDWEGFQPERYGQARLRSWNLPLSDPLNAPVEARLPLTTEPGAPLPAGAYYLRLRALEGPRADVVLLVSRTRLTLQAGSAAGGTAAALVWATDVITGTPLAGLPIALYQGGALVQQATTDEQGLARFAGLGRGLPGYVALAGGPQVGAVEASPDPRRAGGRTAGLFLAADRQAYYPGDPVRLAGVVHLADASPPPVAISIGAPGAGRLYQATLRPGPTGVFSATVPLPDDVLPGEYTLAATAGGAAAQVSLAVRPRPAAPLRVDVQLPARLAGGDDMAVTVAVAMPEGLPLAGATISWTLTAERAQFAGAGEFVFGDDERAQARLDQRAGVAQSDADGRFTLVVTDLDLADVPLRYRFVAEASGPGGAGGVGVGHVEVAPAERSAGVRLDSRLFAVGRAGAVELLALDATGQPAPRTSLRVEVYQRTWERVAPDPAQPDAISWVPRDRIAFSRSAVAGGDGRVRLPLTLARGGAYRLRVSTAESAANASYSAVSIWASAPGFASWGTLPGDQPLLIADRAFYRPGDTATFLLAGIDRPATILISRGGAGGPQAQARSIRAGETFTLTIMPDDAPALAVTVLAATRAERPPAAATLAPLPSATALLPVAAERAGLDVTIESDRAAYLPGDTATLTVTTRDAAGRAVASDVVLSVASAPPAASAPIAEALRSGPPPLQTAPRASALPLVASPAPAPQPVAPGADGGFWDAGLRTDADGVLTATLQLPQAPEGIQVSAWAASAGLAGQAHASLPISQPIELQLIAPPAFRAGDQVELAAQLRNTGAVTHAVTARLTVAGLALLESTPPAQQALVAPGEARQFTWRGRVLAAAGVRGSIAVELDGAPFQTEPIVQPTLPAETAPAPANRGLALLREYLDPQTGQPLDLAALRAGQLVRARLTLVCIAAQRSLTIDEPLPAGAAVVAAPPGAFDSVARAPGRLTLARAELGAGIVQYEYTLRLIAAGRYYVPAPAARADGAQGFGRPHDLIVAAP